MMKQKIVSVVSLLLIVNLLNGCQEPDEDSSGINVIYAIMAAGALVGLVNTLRDKEDDSSDSSSDDEQSSDDEDDEQSSDEDDEPSSEDEDDAQSSEEVLDERFFSVKTYDGIEDDLLTAGLGQTGLISAAPTATDPENPTASEIRRATIVNQYQALQDMRSSAGYGIVYGPAVSTQFVNPTNNGQVAGKEYLAYADDGSGRKNVTMMVQLPDDFDPDNPCIVAAPSPGSRGVYGAIGAIGEWGLKNHCAVAYTDKGTGNGVHDLTSDTVNLIDGTRDTATNADKEAHFKAQGTDDMDLSAYSSTYPYRIAQKHAHSQQNPEDAWGDNVLEAIELAFDVLNLEANFGEKDGSTIKSTITPSNTLVIAAGISSGGAASLRATEQDSRGLIDGVVVAAPMINPRDIFGDAEGVTIKQGDLTFSYQQYRKSLFDVITYYNIYQPCASANTTGLSGRCLALSREELLDSYSLQGQISEAQGKLNTYGTLKTTNAIAHNYEASLIYASYANLYANAYGRFSVVDNLCDYSYAASDNDGSPRAKTLSDLADDFQTSNGIPPSSGTNLINNNGNNGNGINFRLSTNVNGTEDGDLEGALCLRRLATGTTGVTINQGSPLTGTELDNYERVQEGLQDILASGDLRGKAAIMVHGRDDALAHVNFTARAYYGLNQKTESNSQLFYIEVKNAHHFDALNQQYNINTHIPLIYYFHQALDLMYDHLKNEAGLPPSQVIPSVPSDDICPITFRDDVLTIPTCE
jgi:hydroxybutyrate-dimer hydrolase